MAAYKHVQLSHTWIQLPKQFIKLCNHQRAFPAPFQPGLLTPPTLHSCWFTLPCFCWAP